ncbi:MULTISPECIES: DEAD/DEAH box helicase family protein [Mycobacteroides]|uniref:DEAD/DEAH box helicase family protein n=1 Tax=Mycobacteroides TaxID=670516 RepID=UPI00092864A0|nr:DEAD/DEAH box helicase family protein [Mycobacteroides abscessus]MBF9435266.1 DEAD/DEAH box helicase family protein [Mycobacteroides chelonae]MBN7507524.1 DEAD/DEAH box helicase family protein [Mycobacteroides abscessus subsp. massiliense]MDO3037442.1 DEAD/DEAH box helicase family protein [Mycobacteroides abscessus subsp. abscessus]MDO3113052.1 DEAD/DEAH box helicase family protein [Mycobacteroides abscessus subsp. massiliense]MDO3262039.1 DEAD/DEAH box helicase family protein [Mycobacteroi
MTDASRGLRTLTLQDRYRSDNEDVVGNFFVPAFSVASSYSRAVGYFTSTSLALYARGIEVFANRGGSMRLIASPHLNEDDIIDIERGYDVRAVLERATLRELDCDDQPATVLDGLGLLGRLIAEGRLDIKLAFVEQDSRVGIYHEKIGVFRDDLGDLVGFTGSSNETYGGLMANFESVEVYRGWIAGDGARALRLEADFQSLWSDQTPNLRVERFSDVARERLIKLGRDRPARTLPARDDALTPETVVVNDPTRLRIPAGLDVRDYQREAVMAWLRQQGRGILKMATGTGKTKTAMIAATKLGDLLREREEPLILLVLAPLTHLVDQWITEVEDFGVRPVAVYESSAKWMPVVEEQLAAARMGQRPVVVMIATNDSFSGQRFQSILSRITQPILIIADEAHNLGSSTFRDCLPENATYRLGLSATPERWFDDEGTDALIDYFGPVCFELGLAEAISMGALTRYTYVPRLIELNDAEANLYVDLSAQIAQRIASGDDLKNADPESPLGFLLRQRAGVLGHAEGKIAALRADLDARRDQWFQLIYCAEGKRPSEPGEPPGPKQVDEVMHLVGNELHLSGHTYVSETSRSERKALLRRFGSGNDLRTLIAMRCLDEGVDIPDARVGYILASSSNPRQFIQRRGRLLRRAPGKERAEILDYLAVPPAGTPINFSIERSLLIRELERANEFGKLSENYETTLQTLRPLKERYQLMDM